MLSKKNAILYHYIFICILMLCCWGRLGATENNRTKLAFFGRALYSLQKVLAVCLLIWSFHCCEGGMKWFIIFFNGLRTLGCVGDLSRGHTSSDWLELNSRLLPPNPVSLLIDFGRKETNLTELPGDRRLRTRKTAKVYPVNKSKPEFSFLL